jgi:hypothetical protein
MTAETITRALGGTWRGNRGVALCPSHREKTPSLAIREADGRVLVHCHAGCEQADVVAALRGRGLWPERESQQRPLTRADRHRLAREAGQRRAAEARAEHWRRGRELTIKPMAEAAKPVDLVGRRVRSKKVRHIHDAVITKVCPATYWLGRADGSLSFSNRHSRDDFDLLPDAPEDERREPCGQ